MWEKFTTKHLVDTGEWKRIGEVLTPWTCFSLVATERAIGSDATMASIRHIVDITNAVATEFKHNKDGATTQYVADHHRMSTQDAAEWLDTCDWDCSLTVDASTLDTVVTELRALNLMDRHVTYADLIAPQCTLRTLANLPQGHAREYAVAGA